MAPATQSFLPLINLVMLYTMMSAPSLAGEMIMGLKVLSTISCMLCFRQISERAGMSDICSNGFVMDSV